MGDISFFFFNHFVSFYQDYNINRPKIKTQLQTIVEMANEFYYSNKYEDDEYEYRHVHVTKEVKKTILEN